MHSMTGFGSASRSSAGLEVTVEVRTVNGRYLDVNTRLPRELAPLESKIRKAAKARLRRGRVEVWITLLARAGNRHQLDEEAVRAYLEMAERVARMGGESTLDTAALLQLPGVLAPGRADSSGEELEEIVLGALDQALDQVLQARIEEGRALRKDLEGHLENLVRIADDIGSEAAAVGEYHRRRLEERIREVGPIPVDEGRLAQEVAYYAERGDISEEMARLGSHLAQFRQSMEEAGDQAIGRQLDFICQEMSREINTILSKSSLAGLSRRALEGKSEIEKIREQVQNVE